MEEQNSADRLSLGMFAALCHPLPSAGFSNIFNWIWMEEQNSADRLSLGMFAALCHPLPPAGFSNIFNWIWMEGQMDYLMNIVGLNGGEIV
jgi:hypothetical protein